MNEEKLYKLNEVAAMLSVSRTQLQRWIAAKKIRAVKLGAGPNAAWRISESALEEFKGRATHNVEKGE